MFESTIYFLKDESSKTEIFERNEEFYYILLAGAFYSQYFECYDRFVQLEKKIRLRNWLVYEETL